MKAILAGIKLLLAVLFAAIRSNKIVKGNGTSAEKAVQIKAEFDKVIAEATALAKATETTWDDAVVEAIDGVSDIVAARIIDALEKEGAE